MESKVVVHLPIEEYERMKEQIKILKEENNKILDNPETVLAIFTDTKKEYIIKVINKKDEAVYYLSNVIKEIIQQKNRIEKENSEKEYRLRNFSNRLEYFLKGKYKIKGEDIDSMFR